MHARRFIAFLLGCFFCGNLFLTYVATHNFRVAEEISAQPPKEASYWFEQTGPGNMRLLLRHEANEMNYRYFESWGYMDLALSASLLLLSVFSRGTKTALLLSLFLTLLACAQVFLLVPEIGAYGRLIDFQPAPLMPVERAKFWSMHNMYSGLMVVRLLIGMGILGTLLWRMEPGTARGRMRKVRKLNAVDHADHSHIDR